MSGETNLAPDETNPAASGMATNLNSGETNPEEFREEMLRKLFKTCDDEIRTGHVRSVDLINAIQSLIRDPIDRRLVEKLSTMMDPMNDNAYLTIDEFVVVGKKWLGFVMESNDEDIENRSDVSNVPKLKGPLKSIPPVRPTCFKRNFKNPDNSLSRPANPLVRRISNSDSSLGLLNFLHFETTFSDQDVDDDEDDGDVAGSDNLLRRRASQAYQERLDALTKELDDLRKRNSKLSEEKAALQNQCLVAEDSICLLQKEKDQLRTQLEHTCELKAALELKLNQQSDSFLQSEEKCSSIKENLNNYRDLSESMTSENNRLKEELDKCQESLNVARSNCNDSVAVADELTRKLENLKLEMTDQAVAFDEMRKEKTILTSKLSETQQIKDRLEAEIQLCKTQLSLDDDDNKSPNNWEMADAVSVNPDQLFDVAEISFDRPEDFDDVFRSDDFENIFKSGSDKKDQNSRRKAGPSAFSTPFSQKFMRPVRGSIGDEMKKLGVAGLPLCEKHENSKDATEVSTQTENNDILPKSEIAPDSVTPDSVATDNVAPESVALDNVATDNDAPDKIQPNKWTSPKLLFLSGLTIIALLAFFTFLGGIKYGDQTLYPITWAPEYGFPDPVFNFGIKVERKLNFW